MITKKEKNTDQKVKAIVWDWNGTLLDDVHICVDSINIMLGARNLHQLDYESYRDVFGFPVRAYYEKAGFNFLQEPFDVVAIQFIDIYREHLLNCNLFPEVMEVLNQILALQLPQYILSAMEQQLLETSLTEKGIPQFFNFIAGTSDHYADGKLGSAKRLQQMIEAKPKEILLVGDTIHDFEVAEEMGWQCMLIANGHQSELRLEATGKPVLKSLAALPALLNGHSI
ncbi:MAG: HAD family hydrolase [Bacteroidales bacterium]|nr:HAD family hydrolase [Bacteroidales bacterium]